MKKILLLIAFCFGMAANAQVADSTKTIFAHSKQYFTTAQTQQLTADFKKFNIKTQVFSVYNATTNSNDIYWKGPKAFASSRSKLLADNLFPGPKYDSLNPSASADFNNAILAGVVESLLSKLN